MISKSREYIKSHRILKFYHCEIESELEDLSDTIDFTEQLRIDEAII
jgi:hypothetical protein